LLPFVDQASLYNQINFQGAFTAWTEPPNLPEQGANVEVQQDPTGEKFRNKIIPLYMCPSEDSTITDGWSPKANYCMSMGNQRMDGGGTAWGTCSTFLQGEVSPIMIPGGNMFRTAAAGHGNTWDAAYTSGVVSRLCWASNMRDLVDGPSNVIMMGEIRPQCGDHSRNGWFHFNSLWIATTAPLNYPIACVRELGWDYPTPPPPYTGPCNHWQNWQTSQGFRSRHAGGGHFLMGDGAVRFISESIGYLTYQRLGDRRDGGVVGEF
jgi:hypothetical protein